MFLKVRKDLKMRKGKMVAQSAHAAMKLFLEYTRRENGNYTLPAHLSEEFEGFLSSPNVKASFVFDEAEIDNLVGNFSSLIVDNGRTEFHGVPTKTVLASHLFNEPKEDYDHITDQPSLRPAKQILIFSKQNPLKKEISCELGAISCLKTLRELMMYNADRELIFDYSKSPALAEWLKGAFAKISLSVKTDEDLIAMSEKMTSLNIVNTVLKVGDNMILSTEPCFFERIDPVTQHLPLI